MTYSIFRQLELMKLINSISFDSFMKLDSDLKEGELRLLAVDHPVHFPAESTIRVLVTSEDVIHS
jgi:cytochrome c oxidase subunit 2